MPGRLEDLHEILQMPQHYLSRHDVVSVAFLCSGEVLLEADNFELVLGLERGAQLRPDF